MNVVADGSTEADRAKEFGLEALPHLDLVYRVALRFVGERDAAEDLVQQTMLKAYRAWDQYRVGTNIRAWLLTILRNEVFIGHRRRKRARHVLDTRRIEGVTVFDRKQEADPEGQFFHRFVDDEVVRAVDSLPVEYREAVVLRYVESLSYAEIAEIAGVPVGTVKSRLSRGRKMLRERLRAYAEQIDYVRAGTEVETDRVAVETGT